jgi:hypothetical protein
MIALGPTLLLSGLATLITSAGLEKVWRKLPSVVEGVAALCVFAGPLLVCVGLVALLWKWGV